MKKANKNTVNTTSQGSDADVIALNDTFQSDLKNSVLVVSLLVNMVVLVAFMVVQSTSVYDHQVISLLLAR